MSTKEAPVQQLSTWRYNSPYVQTIIVGLVLFCCPGTYLAMTGLGAGGLRADETATADKANIIAYCIFGASGLFSGSLINQIGPKYTLMIGAVGYSIYAGSLWYIDAGDGTWFTLFGGFCLGSTSGLLWGTQGYITTTYPDERQKGKYIATSWVLNATGSLVGAAVVLGVTVNDQSSSGVPRSIYITFICLECCGILVASLLMDPSKVRRNDGRGIADFKPLPWKKEIASLFTTILEPKMALVTLAIFSSELYLSMTGSFNAFYFNARTRALANLVYWIMQILSALLIAYVCDAAWIGSRRKRAMVAGCLVATVIGGTFIAMLVFLSHNRLDRSGSSRGIDWTDGTSFAGPFVIYIFFGACYPLFQNYHHWLYSTFSNEPHVLARYSGYFKGFQAWGTATAFGIDSHLTPFLTEAAAFFSLMMAGLALSVTSAYLNTTNTNYGKENGVVVPEAFEKISEAPVIVGEEGVVEREASISKQPKQDAEMN
ncbi:hypothetical protein BP6252_08947 [Coleophoma cylindrospora]|uniref:DUF895 domain membrane protein n=1 Tax=Coleophoma cylindrospora TaxID=1849047 RepID=A0A3D8R0W4_9HELO|nr:hypothetical protein BP6252_08947 [Coleophoma cylindrospora]